MNARRLFYTDAGALRALWRVIGFLGASAIATVIAAAICGPFISMSLDAADLRGVTNQFWVELIGLLAGTTFMLRVVDKRPWSDIWMGTRALRPALLAFGFAIGAVAIGIPILSLIAGRWLRDAGGGAGSWWGAAARVSALLLPAALSEELMTRGYVLSVLRGAWGWRWAIALTSVGFGLLHLQNNGATAGSLSLVILAGLFLAGVLYVTQSLYAAWMAHFAWNWTMAVIFHAAVSGYPFESPRYRYVDAGPDWATGGDWGPEGGVPAALGMGAGMGIVFLIRRRRTSRQLHS